jgi:hypothetical protein
MHHTINDSIVLTQCDVDFVVGAEQDKQFQIRMI